MECENVSDTESDVLSMKNELKVENLNMKESAPVVIESVMYSTENSSSLHVNKHDYEESEDMKPLKIKSETSNLADDSNNDNRIDDNDIKSNDNNNFLIQHPIVVPIQLDKCKEFSCGINSNNKLQEEGETGVKNVYVSDSNNLFLINNESLNVENENCMCLKNEDDSENENIDSLIIKDDKQINNDDNSCNESVEEKKIKIETENTSTDFNEEINNTMDTKPIIKRGRGRPRVLFKKTHPCSICHKVFSRKTHLTTHLRIHSDEKPYMCNLCCKRFRDNSVLIKHIRVHTQDKPYTCSVCNLTFIYTFFNIISYAVIKHYI